MSKLVVVTGMNRSGTSLAAQALERLGVYFGEEGDLVPADEANPRGYYEHRQIVEHQTQLMDCVADRNQWDDIGELNLSSVWDDEIGIQENNLHGVIDVLSAHSPFGIKTTYLPRIPSTWSWLLRDYTPLYVHCMRYPAMVMMSTVKANDTQHKLTEERKQVFYRQWAWHNAELFKLEPRVEIWFDNWWPNPDVNMKKLADALGVEPVDTEGLLL